VDCEYILITECCCYSNSEISIPVMACCGMLCVVSWECHVQLACFKARSTANLQVRNTFRLYGI
jgi:hypothetical protein